MDLSFELESRMCKICTGMSLSMVLGIPTTATLRPRLLTSCMDDQVELLINCYFSLMQLASEILNKHNLGKRSFTSLNPKVQQSHH